MDSLLVVPIEKAPRELSAWAEHAEGTLEWFRTLAATTLESGENAVMAVLEREGKAVAALPLARGTKKTRALTAPYTTEFAPLSSDVEAAHTLGRLARGYTEGVLRLEGLDLSNSKSAALLDGLQHSGLACAVYEGFANWFEPVNNFQEYWARRPSRLKETVRRKSRAIVRSGLSFSCLRSHTERAVAAYAEVYGASWKQAEPHRDFIPELLAAMGADVRLGVMSLAGQALAAQIWLIRNGRGTIFKLAHREDAATYSPGTLLTAWMCETLIRDDKLHEIDFGRGDDAYKRDWLSCRRTRSGVILADWRSAAGVTAMLREIVPTFAARAVKRRLASDQTLSARMTIHPMLSTDLS